MRLARIEADLSGAAPVLICEKDEILTAAKTDELTPADQALVEIGAYLKTCNYRFTTITPASHHRVMARADERSAARDQDHALKDMFGWSRPLRRADVPHPVLSALSRAGELAQAKGLEASGSLLRSNVRYSTLDQQLFVHSAYPTETSDAVFFGPDTYRFARMLRHALVGLKVRSRCRIIDIGAGSGAGGLHAAAMLAALSPTLVLSDINPRALRFCRVNAALNGVRNVQAIESDLFKDIAGSFDLIISNPPYLVDPLARLYRHGGGKLGFDLSLRIVQQGIERLAPGGCLLLYTGSAIVAGVDAFHAALRDMLDQRSLTFSYEEIDPDVFGEELEHPPYDTADRIAVVAVTVTKN